MADALSCPRRRRVYGWSLLTGWAMLVLVYVGAVVAAGIAAPLLSFASPWRAWHDDLGVWAFAPAITAFEWLDPGRDYRFGTPWAGLFFMVVLGWGGMVWLAGSFWMARARTRWWPAALTWGIITLPCTVWAYYHIIR